MNVVKIRILQEDIVCYTVCSFFGLTRGESEFILRLSGADSLCKGDVWSSGGDPDRVRTSLCKVNFFCKVSRKYDAIILIRLSVSFFFGFYEKY